MTRKRDNVIKGRFLRQKGLGQLDRRQDGDFSDSPQRRYSSQRTGFRGLDEQTWFDEPKGRRVLRGRGEGERISWTFIAVIGFIAICVGAFIGIEMAKPDRAERPSGDLRTADGTAFGYCHMGGGTNCVVDGDTIWMNGVNIRLLDIDTPETHEYGCEDEKALGDAATRRLHQLLNGGVVTAERGFGERDEDQYGRKLRVVMVDGEPVGDVLVAEGLARWYGGGRRSWC